MDSSTKNDESGSIPVHSESGDNSSIAVQLKATSISQTTIKKLYKMSFAIQDFDCDCLGEIFKHLTLRQKFAVERVSRSWQESIKKALLRQRDLVIVSSTVSRQQYKIDFRNEVVYQKSTASKLIALLPNIETLTLVGFEINYQRYAIVKKFPKTTSLVFQACTIAQDNEWLNLKSNDVSEMKSIELNETRSSETFLAGFCQFATSLKKVTVRWMPSEIDYSGPDAYSKIFPWLQLFDSMSSTVVDLFALSPCFAPYLHYAFQEQSMETELASKLRNLNSLEVSKIEFVLLLKLMPLMPQLKKLTSIIFSACTDKITGKDLQIFKDLEQLDLFMLPDPECLETLSLEDLASMPSFPNLKRLSLVHIKITAENWEKLFANIPNVTRLEISIYQTECCSSGSSGRICGACCTKFYESFANLRNLKSLSFRSLMEMGAFFINLFEKNYLPQLRFLQVDQEIVNDSFLKAVFDFANKKPKQEFILDTKTKISVFGKPRNVTIVP